MRADKAVVEALTASLSAIIRIKGEVSLVGKGVLPNDGKVIEDKR